MNAKISLFIIVKNEAEKIAACIESAKGLVSEVIVVVSDQTVDNTAQVARAAGATVYSNPFQGFTHQKNFALTKVSGDWALNLDADEHLSEALKEEILNTLDHTPFSGFNIPFENYFLGARMKYSGLNKEKHLRLVRTKGAKYTGGLVHEKLEIEGKVGLLKNCIRHYSYSSVTVYFNKFNTYTTLGARELYRRKRKVNPWVCFLRIPYDFSKRYFLKLGFLDGLRGFIWAALSSYYGFAKYIKLWTLYQQEAPHDR